MDNVKSIRPDLNTPHELVQDLIKMLPEVEGILSAVSFKNGSCRCSFTNMALGDLLFLLKMLDLEIGKRMAATFMPD